LSVAGVGPEEERWLRAAGEALARHTGLSLSAGLALTLRTAVEAAARERGETPSALAAAAAAGEAGALELLAEHAVVGETSFWRHPEALLALAAEWAGHPAPRSIWCAGCASGEEPYSLAMALAGVGRVEAGAPADRILATDLSARALALARAGGYGLNALRRLPAPLRGRWLRADRAAAAWRVDDRLRGLVRYERHNLLDPPPGQGFDAILCRNVVIYFEPEVARATLARLVGALAPGGWLVLGPVELPLASGLPLQWVERGGATLLRRG
jgi:chemotaxis protein methyltransferase CheR